MGLTNTPTSNTTQDTDNDTPPHTQPIRPFSFTNGTSKNHHQPPPHAAVAYRECLKNHAANIGGHALDGCGEFMPSHTATPTDPTSLKCAACGCHRNFHRREYEEYSSPFITTTTLMSPHFLDFHPTRRSSPSSPSSQPPPPPPTTIDPYSSASPKMLLALSTAAHDDQQVPNHHHYHRHQVATPVTPRHAKAAEINLSGRKRFRTKFSQEQKEKMQSFAEKLGWKMQKRDDDMVQNFCNEIGVARGVLKVWMHNNKNSLCRRSDINNPNINLNPTKMEEENNVNDIGSDCNNEIRDTNLDLDCNDIANGASSSS